MEGTKASFIRIGIYEGCPRKLCAIGSCIMRPWCEKRIRICGLFLIRNCESISVLLFQMVLWRSNFFILLTTINACEHLHLRSHVKSWISCLDTEEAHGCCQGLWHQGLNVACQLHPQIFVSLYSGNKIFTLILKKTTPKCVHHLIPKFSTTRKEKH